MQNLSKHFFCQSYIFQSGDYQFWANFDPSKFVLTDLLNYKQTAKFRKYFTSGGSGSEFLGFRFDKTDCHFTISKLSLFYWK